VWPGGFDELTIRFFLKSDSFLTGEWDCIRNPHPPQEPFDDSVEQFLVSLRFQQSGKLDQLGIEKDSIG